MKDVVVCDSRRFDGHRLTHSPLCVILIVMPLLLPDFYVWKAYFNPQAHPVLIYLWLFGVVMKYVSLVVAAVVCFVNRASIKLGITAAYLLFFVCIAASTVAHGFGLSGLKDVWNQMLLGLPAVLYFPTVITYTSDGKNDKGILSVVAGFAGVVGIVTILMYAVFPAGFGTAFGVCNTMNGRLCGTFVGLHTTTILYGLILLASALLMSMLFESRVPVWAALAVTAALLFFSDSVTAKLEALVLVVAVALCLLLAGKQRFATVTKTVIAPFVIQLIAIVAAFAIPLVSQTRWFSSAMIRLHRDPTLSGRLSLYKIATDVFEKHPLFGVGYSQKYYTSILINGVGQHLSFPHNSYLQILMECGLVGLVIFLLLVHETMKSHASLYCDTTETIRNVVFICAVVAGSTSGDFFEGRFYLLLMLLHCVGVVRNKQHPEAVVKDYRTDADSRTFEKNRPNVLLFMTKLDDRGIEHVYLPLIPRLTNTFNFVIARYGSGQDEIANRFSDMGCKIVRLNVSRFRHPLRFVAAVRQVIADNDIAVFHSNVGYSTFFGLLAAWLSKTPVRIAHSHSGQFGTLHNPLNGMFRFLCQVSCHFLATVRINIGEASRHSLFFESDKSLFVPNGIDLDSFRFDSKARRDGRNRFGAHDSTEVFLHIGRMYEVKNHRFLISVFHEYHRAHPDSLLLLAGDGELMDSLRRQVSELSLSDCVVFLGNVNNVSPLYSIADVLIFPSLFEGLPVTLVEAQANGIPVFASDVIDRIVDLSDNITFLPLADGPQRWAQTLPVAPVKREVVPRSEKLEQFDCSRTAETIAKIYRGELQ